MHHNIHTHNTQMLSIPRYVGKCSSRGHCNIITYHSALLHTECCCAPSNTIRCHSSPRRHWLVRCLSNTVCLLLYTFRLPLNARARARHIEANIFLFSLSLFFLFFLFFFITLRCRQNAPIVCFHP